MSSSLDKLKALTSRLEDKLVEKGKKQAPPEVKVQSELPAVEKVTVPTETAVKEAVITAEKEESTFVENVPKKGTENCENIRDENIARVQYLYEKLKISEKSPDFSHIFVYKAMNLSGIGLKEDDFGKVREGKYIQVIAITYEPDKNGKKKAKNISLGYFGKAETLDAVLKNEIIEFVLRWRYEKAFQNVEHYKDLLDILDKTDDSFEEEKGSSTLF